MTIISMDPISITGTLLTIIQIGATIYGGLKGIEDVPFAIENVRREIDALQPILVSLKDYLGDESPLTHFPQALQSSLSENLDNLKYVELQILDAVKGYLNLPGARWAKLKRQFTWAVSKEKDVDRLRSHLAAHKATLQLTFTMVQQLEMGKASQKQEEIHAAVVSAAGQSKSTNDLLVEIKGLVGDLQTKDEPSKTSGIGGVQLDSTKTKTYLNSLAEFINSGCYEAASHRVEFEQIINSSRSNSPSSRSVRSNNSTSNDNTHSTPTSHSDLPAAVGTIAATAGACVVTAPFFAAVMAKRMLGVTRARIAARNEPVTDSTPQIHHRECDNQTQWSPPANPPVDYSRLWPPPPLPPTVPAQQWGQFARPSSVHTPGPNFNPAMGAPPATTYHPPPIQQRELSSYCFQPPPQHTSNNGTSYSTTPSYPTTPRTMPPLNYTYSTSGQNPNYVLQNYQLDTPRQAEWTSYTPPAGVYYPSPSMYSPVSSV